MRKPARVSLAFIAAICLLPSCIGERLTPEIRDAWARPGETGQNSAVYFSLQNTAQEDKLLEVQGEVAESIQLHETIIDSSGTASMHHMEEVSIRYQKIIWTYVDGNLQASDSWKEGR